jgi:LysM repeat protein
VQYAITPDTLRQANLLTSNTKLKVGQKLVIPEVQMQ